MNLQTEILQKPSLDILYIEEIFQRNVIMESEKKQELVIDGNSFYEIDLKCLEEKKQKQEEAEKRQQKRQRK